MKTNLQLIRKGWVTSSSADVVACVRGQAHLGDECLDTAALAERFSSVVVKGLIEGFDDLVSRLNGCWVAVVVCGDNVYLAVDHLRSIQLLYRQENDVLHVFDDMENFRKDHQLEFDEDCVHEYLSSGYVYGNRTLFKGTYSLQAAERVVFVAGRIDARRYWRYIPNIDKPVVADDALVERIDKTFEASMRRLVESVGGKRIVVPLSGGYDSRLIVNYLYKLGVTNVLCYSYGVKGNGESRCSQEIASRLGYEWHYVEYTDENRTALVNDPQTDACFRYMINGTNRYCNQEHIALSTLKADGVISPDRDLIVPGYYFDVLAGSKIKPSTNWLTAVTNSMADENCFFLHGAFCRTAHSIRRIFKCNDDIAPRKFFETFLWQERLAKFIVNNVRDYEFLGFDWRLPVCDRELFSLWLSFPYSMRYGRKYFRNVFPLLAVAAIQDVSFSGQGDRESMKKKIRHWISERMPYVARYGIERMLRRRCCGLSGGVLGSARIDVEALAKVVAARFQSCQMRLSNLSNVTENATFVLKGLAEEAELSE